RRHRCTRAIHKSAGQRWQDYGDESAAGRYSSEAAGRRIIFRSRLAVGYRSRRIVASDREEETVVGAKALETCPSPFGRRWRDAPDEGSSPHGSVNLCKFEERVALTRRCRATLSRRVRDLA